MGDLRYDSRDYVVVEVRTDEELTGVGVGMARYAPVAEMIDRNITPLLLGKDPLMSEALWESMYYSNLPIGQQGVYMRALSAVDIALWDLRGKAAGLPVWQLLGGYRQQIPAVIAGGYAAKGKTLDDLKAELTGYIGRGYKTIKVAAGSIEKDTERLTACRAAVGPDTKLAYDVHWAWRDLGTARQLVRQWEALNLAWIEDPFPSELVDFPARLRAMTSIPLALGEDATGRWAYRELFRRGVVDIVRLDATTTGGISEALRICSLAAAEGLVVLPHIFPEIHVHLAAAFSNVTAVEVTEPTQEIDVLFRLLRSTLEVRDGNVEAPTAPGLGIEIDWAAVNRLSRQTVRGVPA
jgi:D-arabinonate dehydratase